MSYNQYKSGNESLVVSAIMIAIMAALAFGWVAFKAGQCGHVCEANGHKPDYVVGDGCYCRSKGGLYNPRDSR